MGRAGLGTFMVIGVAIGCVGPTSSTDLPSEWREPVAGIEFVLVESGQFRMGLLEEPADLRPAPPHVVEISRPYYLGKFEVTQAEWSAVMGENPSRHPDCPDCPVESVDWHEAQEFLARLEQANPGERFRLPSEAEWEFACRAGGEGRYGGSIDTLPSGSANVDERIPFEGRSSEKFLGHPAPVGSYPPNQWGFYDLSGNVWEWTADRYCPYSANLALNPFGSCATDTIPIRGGSWYFSTGAARCGRRHTHHSDDSGFSIGFRVVREVPAELGTT